MTPLLLTQQYASLTMRAASRVCYRFYLRVEGSGSSRWKNMAGLLLCCSSIKETSNLPMAHARYTPISQSGLPPCPPPPGALRPLPLPGEDIPAHRVRLKNLPAGCTLEQVLEYCGKHASNVMDWNRDGYKSGVQFVKVGQKG